MPATATTVTIPDVELVKVGTWAASTGITTITPAHLEAMLAAASDTEVDHAPIKLGHTGALADLGDSEPALGWVGNLRLADDGNTLVGDLLDVPAGMEPAILAGYKRRSVEIAENLKTPSGIVHERAIVGLALLGVKAPAVKGLADIEALYKTAAAALEALDADRITALALWDEPMAIDRADRIADQLRWARESAAGLAALVGIEGLQTVFDALDAMASRAALAAGGDHAHIEPVAPGGTMTDLDLAKVRELLKLPADTTDDALVAKLTELQTKVDAVDTGSGGAGGGAPAGTTGAPAPGTDTANLGAGGTDTPAGSGGPEVVTLSASAYAELQAQAGQGVEARNILRTQEIDGIVNGALQVGKFTVAEAPEYRTLLTTNFDAGKALIDKLAAGKVPTTELGDAHPGAPTQLAEDAAWDAWAADLFDGDLPAAPQEA